MRRVLALGRVTPEPGPDADAVTHEWVTTIELDASDLAGPAHLEVHGIATVWDVLVNDVVVASGRSMFQVQDVDVTDRLRVGTNDVRVRVHPLTTALDEVPRRPRARWRTLLTDEPRLRWVRTSVLGRAPGFAPGPPVVGPHRPLVLHIREGVEVSWLSVRTAVSDDGDGLVDVEATITGPDQPDQITVEVCGPSGSVHVDATVQDGRLSARLDLPGVTRWWPHTHGTPALYGVRLRHEGSVLDLPGDATASTDVRRVGFRSLTNDAPGSVALRVNGVAVFTRGAVWTPGDLAVLDQAVALGLNLIRVSGVAAYETDAFHARCDELGLMVWQDLMFSTYDYPLADDGFLAVVEEEVDQQIHRLRRHPSTVVVCGSAEHEQQAAMFGTRLDSGVAGELASVTRGLVEVPGADAVWVDSSPSGGVPPIRVDTGVAQYFGVGAYLRDLPDARHAGVRFASECLAFSNLPDGPATDAGVPRDNGAAWDFADVRRHYLRTRYGEGATLADEQRVTGEVMAELFGEWRRPASPCAGGIVLWLRDLEPGAGWGLLDHEGRPKPAARALAPALAPTAVWFVDEGLNGLDVHVAHDRPGALEVALRVELRRGDGTVVDAAEEAWTIAGHAHRVLGVEELLGRFADASYAYRFGPPAHDLVVAELRATGKVAPPLLRTATWRVPRPATAP